MHNEHRCQAVSLRWGREACTLHRRLLKETQGWETKGASSQIQTGFGFRLESVRNPACSEHSVDEKSGPSGWAAGQWAIDGGHGDVGGQPHLVLGVQGNTETLGPSESRPFGKCPDVK